jgi:hypothetical protein
MRNSVPGEESEEIRAERLDVEETTPSEHALTPNRIGKQPLHGSRDQGNGSQEAANNLEEANAIQAFEKSLPTAEKENQRLPVSSSTRLNIMDTQEDAQEVLWTEPESSLPQPGVGRRKRRHADDEVSQDAGFQNSTKKACFAEEDVPASTLWSGTEYERNAEVVGEIATAQSTMAKKAISQHRAAIGRKGRLPWSSRETSELIQLIEEFGTSWTLIKEMDNQRSQILTERDQVALKDKARNIKFATLKSKSALFRNFESVALTTAMKKQLEALNIDIEGLPS